MKKSIVFILMLATITAAAQPKSRALITTAERDLIPEGIAVFKNTIYISSIQKHRIVAIDAKGRTRNLITTNQDGYGEGLGLKADAANGLLWALSNRKDGNRYISQIHGFDLTTGQTKYYQKLEDTIQHLFNDLDLAASGIIYITDAYGSAVYTFDRTTNKLTNFFKSPYAMYPNGLALGKSNQLYIATYARGLMQLNLKTKSLKPLSGYSDSALAHGLDGLLFWNNTLFGVFNNTDDHAQQAVVQYALHESGDAITGEKLVDKGHPAFYEPTTLALCNNRLYLLANSHLGVYHANKTTTKGIEDKLHPAVILIYSLMK